MDAIFEGMRDGYTPKIAAYLRRRIAAASAMDRAELEARVRRATARASAYGIDVEWDLCRFAYLDFIHGPRFDERCDWAARLLAKPGLSGTERADLLESFHRNYLASERK